MTTEIPENINEEGFTLREEVIRLSETGKIKQTTSFVKKASLKTLETIKRNYERKQLETTNEVLAENLISKFSELMENMKFVENSESMERELSENEMLKKDIKNIVGQITPYIPYIGLFCGAVVVAKHVISSKLSTTAMEKEP